MSNTKLLLLGIAIFGITLSAFVTSTVAWFEISNSLQASNIGITYQDSKGQLEIGMKKNADDEITYAESINQDTLETYSSYKRKDLLDQVSSMYSSKWNTATSEFSSTVPEFRTTYTDVASYHEGAVATSGYYQFEFYLKAREDTYLFLSSDTSCEASHDNNVSIAKSLNDSGKFSGLTATMLDKVQDCVRVSFYTETGYYIYEPNVDESSKTAFAGPLNVKNNDSYFDYVDDKETLYGEYNYDKATLIYDEASTTDSVLSGTATAFNAIHKAGIKPIDMAKSESEGGLVIASEDSHPLSYYELPTDAASFDSETMHPLMKLKAYQPQRMVMSVYIEGWDKDVIDSIGAAEFNLNISFNGLMQPIAD